MRETYARGKGAYDATWEATLYEPDDGSLPALLVRDEWCADRTGAECYRPVPYLIVDRDRLDILRADLTAGSPGSIHHHGEPEPGAEDGLVPGVRDAPMRAVRDPEKYLAAALRRA